MEDASEFNGHIRYLRGAAASLRSLAVQLEDLALRAAKIQLAHKNQTPHRDPEFAFDLRKARKVSRQLGRDMDIVLVKSKAVKRLLRGGPTASAAGGEVSGILRSIQASLDTAAERSQAVQRSCSMTPARTESIYIASDCRQMAEAAAQL